MRNRHAVPDVRGHRQLACLHGRDVRGLHIAAANEHLADQVDGPIPASHARTTFRTSAACLTTCPMLRLRQSAYARSRTGFALRMAEPTTNDTTAPTRMPASTPKWPPRGVMANSAKMLPGEGVATRPAPVSTNTMSAAIPPAHMATIMIGCISTYGK